MQHAARFTFPDAEERGNAHNDLLSMLLSPLQERRRAIRTEIRAVVVKHAERFREGNEYLALAMQELESLRDEHEVCQKGPPDGDLDYETTKMHMLRELWEYADVRRELLPLLEEKKRLNRHCVLIRKLAGRAPYN